MPDHDPSDQRNDTDQPENALDGDDTDQPDDDPQVPTEGIEVADIDAVLSEEVILKLLISAILQGLSASDEGLLAVHQASFRGPLPPPEMMSGYDAVVRDGAERIMAMAEKGQDAMIADRREGRRAERRGQNYALIFLLAVLAVSIAAIVAGQPILGSSVTILCLVSAAIAFIRGRG